MKIIIAYAVLRNFKLSYTLFFQMVIGDSQEGSNSDLKPTLFRHYTELAYFIETYFVPTL